MELIIYIDALDLNLALMFTIKLVRPNGICSGRRNLDKKRSGSDGDSG